MKNTIHAHTPKTARIKYRHTLVERRTYVPEGEWIEKTNGTKWSTSFPRVGTVVKKILAAKTGSARDKILYSINHEPVYITNSETACSRHEVVHELILRHVPNGSYTVPQLQSKLAELFPGAYGIALAVEKRYLAGLASRIPDSIQCNFTLGLNEVRISNRIEKEEEK